MKALQNADTLTKVKQGRLVSQAIPTEQPRLINSGPVNGVYTYQVSVPLLITYSRGGQAAVSQKVVVRMLVTQVDRAKNPNGIAVSDFNFSLANA